MPRLVASRPASFSDNVTLKSASSTLQRAGTSGSMHERVSRSRPTVSTLDGMSSAAAEEELLPPAPPTQLPPLIGRVGFLAQYFAVGLIYGGLPATMYGFLLGYLNVPSFVYSTATTVVTLPWSFKVVFGALNDCAPICGYRRKPYMAIGWSICSATLLVLSQLEMPPPYYCISPASGEYELGAPPCHPGSAQRGGLPTLLMSVAACGYVIADVAADGLTVEYARAEPEERRGYIQSTAYLTRTIGQIAAYALVGLGMNGKQYLGTFDASLSYGQVCLIFGVAAGAMVPVSLLLIPEVRLRERVALRAYVAACWELLRSKAFACVVAFQFFNPAIQYVSSTASSYVQRYWAGVETLQAQLANIVAYGLFSLALWLVRARFLHASWRGMLAATTLTLYAIDAPFSLLTTFGVVRNQYFYLGETLLSELPDAAFFVVSCFVIVEMADEANAGLVYGLLTTVSNLGKSLPSALSNQLFGAFRPALSDASNYLASRGGDQPCFRRVVATSFLVSYGFAAASLLTLPLMPNQKADAQHRKATWPRHSGYARATLVLLGVAQAYSLTLNGLAMNEATMCLRLVGGQGCEGPTNATHSPVNATPC